VWGERKKALLIDSMLIGLDIPKIYLYNPKMLGRNPPDLVVETDVFDCIDGQQRIVAITEFFEGNLRTEDQRYFNELSYDEKESLYNYKFTIAIFTQAEEEDLRLLFLRLQLGAPLNVGEKLHALTGEMKEYVFGVGGNHPFFQSISIPERRYAKETVFAQICINSFARAHEARFSGARYEELSRFFESYVDLKHHQEDIKRINKTLDLLNEHFGEGCSEFRNRAVIVSCYLFFEQLIVTRQESKLDEFVMFYRLFLATLEEQTSRGLDYDPAYREILDFQTNILQAAVGKAAIEARHKILQDYFEYYLQTKTIKRKA
jgi:hypothetical protein